MSDGDPRRPRRHGSQQLAGGSASSRRVAVAGLGAVGRVVAQAVTHDLDGYRVSAVSARDTERARRFTAALGADVPVLPLAELADAADIVVECAPAAVFRELAEPVLERGKQLVVLTAAALLDEWDLVDTARRSGGVVLVPSGALLGLDAVQAAAESEVTEVRMTTRKPVTSLIDAPHLAGRREELRDAREPVQLFTGTAREAAKGFPANLNVAVALSLAGVGPDRTLLEVWADPALDRNTHRVEVRSWAADLRFEIDNIPSEENPGTGRITALSVIALLRKLHSPLRVGT